MRQAVPAGTSASTHRGGGAVCYFCGRDTVRISHADLHADTGRVQLYCDNTHCAAREVTVLVERDGVGAGRRADVRALRALDYPAHLDEPRVHANGLATRKLRGAPDGKSLERRRNTEPLDLLIP
ncbi:hypothetical protein [Blastococcus sp. SYSU DS0539]